MPNKLSLKDLSEFYDQQAVMTLAVARPDGRPYSASVYFAADEQLNLYFISDPSTRHSRILSQNRYMAATIYQEPEMWQMIRCVQVQGECEALSADQAYAYRMNYREKFRYVDQVSDMIMDRQIYIIRPTHITFTDYQKRFGFKVSCDWEQFVNASY